MLVAGCDVGSLTAKAVIMKDGIIKAQAVIRALTNPVDSAEAVMRAAFSESGLTLTDVGFAVGTGYGKGQIPFVQRTESEITCHARGARWKMPGVRTVIDIGGQDAKAIRMDADGNVLRYIYNDKCASGTGRFLEVMAEAMEVDLADLGELGKQSKKRIPISNQCVIFAETEVVSLINEGRDIPDIIAGLHDAMAGRVASLAKSIEVEPDVVMTGGVAKNIGVFEALAARLEMPVKRLEGIDPQLNGALGAALIAAECHD